MRSRHVYSALWVAVAVLLCVTSRTVAAPVDLKDSQGPDPALDGAVNFEDEERTRRQLNIIQDRLNDFLHPQPIVDTITEEEKYGNNVDHVLGQKVVRAVESISNFVNSAFSFPVESVKKVSRGATEFLNNIGARLVGLQKK